MQPQNQHCTRSQAQVNYEPSSSHAKNQCIDAVVVVSPKPTLNASNVIAR